MRHNVTQEFRSNGGVHVRVQVSDEEYDEALHRLHAHAGATGAAMHGGPHPSACKERDRLRARRPTVTTLADPVGAAMKRADFAAEAWKRLVRGEGK